MSRDTIHLDEFSPLTQAAFNEIAAAFDYQEMLYSGNPVNWAAFFFILRELPDTPARFPKGKWVTIQVLESFLIEWTKDTITEAAVAGQASRP